MRPASHPAGDRAPSEPDGARRRRIAVLGGILLAHAAVIAALVIDRTAMDRPARAGSHLLTFDVAAPKPAAAPVVARIVPPVARPTIFDPTPVAPPSVAPIPTLVAESGMPGDGGCDLTEMLGAALRSDPLARAAVASLPMNTRSVANAVMLWDGKDWSAAGGAQAQGAIGILRRVTNEVVASASPECREQPQAGPRLIVMPGAPDVTLALGSGRWRWGDLAPETPRDQAAPTRLAFNYRNPAVAASRGAPGTYLNISFITDRGSQGEHR